MNWLQSFFAFIADPTIALLLVTLGAVGLLTELWHPGAWLPGVAGGIALLLGLYALGMLQANFAGLALIALGIALFMAEAVTPAVGALLVAGIVAFGLGVALLYDKPGLEVSWPLVLGMAAGLGLFVLFISAMGLAAQRRPPLTGGDGLLGLVGRSGGDLQPGEAGSVLVNGEWWTAEVRGGAVAAQGAVRVTGRKGFRLLVEPADKK